MDVHSGEIPPKDHVHQPDLGQHDCFALLKETTSDLRANNRDLRLVLGFLEHDVARLRKDLEATMTRNTALEERAQVLGKEVKRLQERNELLEKLTEPDDKLNNVVGALVAPYWALGNLSNPEVGHLSRLERRYVTTDRGTFQSGMATPLPASRARIPTVFRRRGSSQLRP